MEEREGKEKRVRKEEEEEAYRRCIVPHTLLNSNYTTAYIPVP